MGDPRSIRDGLLVVCAMGRSTGIMMHSSCDYATIRENIVFDNGDAGIVLVESSSCNVYGNSVYSNECEQCVDHTRPPVAITQRTTLVKNIPAPI